MWVSCQWPWIWPPTASHRFPPLPLRKIEGTRQRLPVWCAPSSSSPRPWIQALWWFWPLWHGSLVTIIPRYGWHKTSLKLKPTRFCVLFTWVRVHSRLSTKQQKVMQNSIQLRIYGTPCCFKSLSVALVIRPLVWAANPVSHFETEYDSIHPMMVWLYIILCCTCVGVSCS